MKAVLAIEQGIIPPTIGIATPNSDSEQQLLAFGPQTDWLVVDFAGARVTVVTERIPWPQMPIRRASVNSFGYGGANAHCVLDHVSSVIQGYIPPSRKKGSSTSLSILHPDPRAFSRFMCAQILGIDTRQGGFTQDERSHSISTSQSECFGSEHANDLIDISNPIPNQDPSNGHKHGVLSQLTRSVGYATRRLVLLPFTGHDEVSLRLNITAAADVVDSYHLSDLAYTLASRRSNFPHRAFEVVDAQLPSTLLLPSNAKFGESSYRQRDLGLIFTGNCSETFFTEQMGISTK